MQHSLLALLWALSLCSLIAAQSHLYTFKADSLKRTMDKLSAAGDVNADGYDDFVVRTAWNGINSAWVDGAHVRSGRDGRLLWAIQAQGGAMDVVGVGDLDKDGHDDVVLSVVSYVRKRYELWYISGKTGKRLRTVSLAGFRQPDTLANGGDINKDGYPDLLIGDPTYGFFRSGRAVVVSGKDGSFIYDFRPYGPYYSFGNAVAGAGDVDRDGHDDFLVADWIVSRVYLYSGKTGTVLRTFAERKASWKDPGMGFGVSVAGLGDVDGDGVPDLGVGANGFSKNGRNSGAVFYYSGKTGKRILAIYGQAANWTLGVRIAPVGDWNQDGVPDLAVTATGSTKLFSSGEVFVYSGKNAKILARFPGKKVWQAFGGGGLAGTDLDGDGRTDLLISQATSMFGKPQFLQKIEVWSPVNQALWSDTHKVSLARQGKQLLQLDAGVKHAGSSYFLLGSMTGIKPGLKLGGLTLPLEVDGYFWLTATMPNSALLKGSLGKLDSKGQAVATFTALSGMPKSLVGSRADHAYLLFNRGRFTMTSNWVPLLFEK